MKTYEGNYKAWDFPIIRLEYMPFGLVMKCDENAHKAWKAVIDKYEVSEDKQESLNELTNRWKHFRIKDTSQYTDIWFN